LKGLNEKRMLLNDFFTMHTTSGEAPADSAGGQSEPTRGQSDPAGGPGDPTDSQNDSAIRKEKSAGGKENSAGSNPAFKSADGEHIVKVGLELNARHRIFEGHFPGQPVVPGACLMQMVKEVTGAILTRELQLRRADQLKFIALIDPNADNILEMLLTIRTKEAGQVSVSASLLNRAVVCFKFSGVFRMPPASDGE
jgi:3-hydroxyacyl-[acyl-carrier-protein] dehydratase